MTAYDLATASFISDSPRVGLDSGDERMRREPDGFAMFRFHGPTEALFERSWRLPDLEVLSGERVP